MFLLFLGLGLFAADPVDFDRWFEDKTMRLDYYHMGTATQEQFSVHQIVNDGPWPGSKTQLVDGLGLGKYRFDVRSEKSDQLIYRQGFASLFGEWETIGAAKRQWGVQHESLRFPWPKEPVKVVLHKRNAANGFEKVFETRVDPASRQVNSAYRQMNLNTVTLQEAGPPTQKVDLVILGDGYKATQMPKFRKDARRMVDALIAVEPFKARKGDFNIRLVETPSKESGVSKPHDGIARRSALNASYSVFDSRRYLLSPDNLTIRNVAATVPYDYILILANNRTYGGGGIFRWQATTSVDNAFSPYVFVHEFGHAFAALADEYYTSSVAYESPSSITEPWEPNVTALLDPKALKWGDLVKDGTPLPTPWGKTEFDQHSIETQKKRAKLRQSGASETALEVLFTEQRRWETEYFKKAEFADQVGAFEGGNYVQFGLYRPQADCIMFTRNEVDFCAVCARTINRVIDSYTR